MLTTNEEKFKTIWIRFLDVDLYLHNPIYLPENIEYQNDNN